MWLYHLLLIINECISNPQIRPVPQICRLLVACLICFAGKLSLLCVIWERALWREWRGDIADTRPWPGKWWESQSSRKYFARQESWIMQEEVITSRSIESSSFHWWLDHLTFEMQRTTFFTLSFVDSEIIVSAQVTLRLSFTVYFLFHVRLFNL